MVAYREQILEQVSAALLDERGLAWDFAAVDQAVDILVGIAEHSHGGLRHSASRQRVIPDHSTAGADHVRARPACFFVGESAPLQPVVERREPGVEGGKIVFGSEMFWRAYLLGAVGHRSQVAFEASNRRSLGLSAGALSRAAG